MFTNDLFDPPMSIHVAVQTSFLCEVIITPRIVALVGLFPIVCAEVAEVDLHPLIELVTNSSVVVLELAQEELLSHVSLCDVGLNQEEDKLLVL